MDGKSKIREYRERLAKTLACHDLMDEDALRELVRNPLLKSTQCEDEADIQSFLEKRTKVISNFLDMLRSVSGKDPDISKSHETSWEWKVKQDNEDFRVMYREGPPGTLFHDLLVEGYIDGPIDVCLCVTNEATLYKDWFPQYSIPNFKMSSSECLHRALIGEQIASVKMKVSWPISSRECLLHYTEFEYFQEDLIIVVVNSISGPEDVEKSTHGISKEMIPAEENGMVRMGVVGGFALQKVTNGRTYFRTIGSIDMKLDYVPSWLVNFIARQLIGSGFKLYKKAVSTWANNGNQKFQQALEDPLYVRVREALLSDKIDNIVVKSEPSLSDTEQSIVLEGNLKSADSEYDTRQVMVNDGKTGICSPDRSPVVPKTPPVIDCKVTCEIEEETSEESVVLSEESDRRSSQSHADQPQKNIQVSSQKSALRPEVTEALDTLDKVIIMVRELGINSRMNPLHGVNNTDNTAEEDASKDDELSLKDLVSIDESKEVTAKQASSESGKSYSISSSRTVRSSSTTKDVRCYAVALASSPELNIQNSFITGNGTTTVVSEIGKMTNSYQKNDTSTTEQKVKRRKNRFCCLHFRG